LNFPLASLCSLYTRAPCIHRLFSPEINHKPLQVNALVCLARWRFSLCSNRSEDVRDHIYLRAHCWLAAAAADLFIHLSPAPCPPNSPCGRPAKPCARGQCAAVVGCRPSRPSAPSADAPSFPREQQKQLVAFSASVQEVIIRDSTRNHQPPLVRFTTEKHMHPWLLICLEAKQTHSKLIQHLSSIVSRHHQSKATNDMHGNSLAKFLHRAFIPKLHILFTCEISVQIHVLSPAGRVC
jgi:hypothetical protein